MEYLRFVLQQFFNLQGLGKVREWTEEDEEELFAEEEQSSEDEDY